MAVVQKFDSVSSGDPGDITSNLPTLRFESALTEDESELLILRARSHAITVSACAQATYLVAVMNEARQIKAELRQPKQGRANKLLQETAPRDSLLVGIIGCGKLGSQLANCLLTYGEVKPEELKISTRRPETLGDLQDRGVRCFRDNQKVASSVHILFFCVLPSQVQAVADDIKGLLSTHCTIYSFISSVNTVKLTQLFEFKNIIRPMFSWDRENVFKQWDHTLDVNSAMENIPMLEKTCPLSMHKSESIVTTNEKLAELMIYTFVNMCTTMGLNKQETMDIVHAVIFGQKGQDAITVLSEKDIYRKMEDKMAFPKVDLSAIAEGKSPLTKKLAKPEVQELFVKRYCGVIEQYLEWKKYHQNLQMRGF